MIRKRSQYEYTIIGSELVLRGSNRRVGVKGRKGKGGRAEDTV